MKFPPIMDERSKHLQGIPMNLGVGQISIQYSKQYRKYKQVSYSVIRLCAFFFFFFAFYFASHFVWSFHIFLKFIFVTPI
jgi:hypothetical protein